MERRILFMDNNSAFLDVHARLLERKGYHVLRSSTWEAAEETLKERAIHLAILDIRMEDENDEQDISGLILAQKEEFHAVRKIILTAHTRGDSAYKYAREALSSGTDSPPPAVSFIGKEEGPEALLQAVEQAFTKHVRMNWNLAIYWGELSSFHHLVTMIEPGLSNIRVVDRVGELEDLFRKLFYDSSQITIGRLLVRNEGKIALEVFAHANQRAGEQYVVLCGRKEIITDENYRYETFVPREAGIGNVNRVKTEETLHFAANAYTLIRSDLEEVMTFREYYRTRTSEEIRTTLNALYATTLTPWYAQGRYFEEQRSLDDLYLDWLELPRIAALKAGLDVRMERICQAIHAKGLAHFDYLPHKITLHLSGGSIVSYRNPAAKLHEAQLSGDGPIICGMTHGKVNADSVFCGHGGRTWLLNFSQVGQGPLLRDFVLLETVIKLDLFDSYDLSTRYTLEKQLLAAPTLDAPVSADSLSTELHKALSAATCIRTRAAELIGQDPKSYECGLFFCAMHRLAGYQPDRYYTRRELIQYAHSLLAAAMLYEKLVGTDGELMHIPAGAETCLWFDQHREEIWVEGRRANLTPQEFKFFKVLYDHAGELCTRQTILKGALGRDYTIDDESLFNSAMSRLRQEIEPEPKKPRYIANIRGRGYRLDKQKIYLLENDREISI